MSTGDKPPVRRPFPLIETAEELPPIRRVQAPPPKNRGRQIFAVLVLALVILGVLDQMGPNHLTGVMKQTPFLKDLWGHSEPEPAPPVLPQPEPEPQPDLPPEPDAEQVAAVEAALEADDLSTARAGLDRLREAQTPVAGLEEQYAERFEAQRLKFVLAYDQAVSRGQLQNMQEARDQLTTLAPEDSLLPKWNMEIEARTARIARIQSLQNSYEANLKDRKLNAALDSLQKLRGFGVDTARREKELVRVIPLDDGQVLRLRWIPPGQFTQGSPADEKGRGEDETQRDVTITKGFWLSETEITLAQWNAFSVRDAVGQGEDDSLPYVNCSRMDALDFISNLNGRFGPGYRLPSEAEWEYAARADSTTPFHPAGTLDGLTLRAEVANFDGTQPYRASDPQQPYLRAPRPVAKGLPNAWGLFDMHGNVWEWCLDSYGPYEPGPQTDPVLKLMLSRSDYVVRGGGWGDYADQCRSAKRFHFPAQVRLQNLGFRVLLEAESP